MSVRTKIANLSTDWRDGHVLRVTEQVRDSEGNWKDTVFSILKAQDVLDDLWTWSGRRFIIEEYDTTKRAFK